MFFFFSKVLAFLIRPFIWALATLLFAFLTKSEKRRRRLLLAGLGILLVFTNEPLFNAVAGWWETETITARDISEPYDIGILLGGYSSIDPAILHQRYDFSSRANRFINTYELYRRGKFRKFLLTGGAGRIWTKGAIESQVIAEYLKLLGVPAEDILVEPASRNTWENALYSRQLVEQRFPEARCLLITSAWHMHRAERCFQQAGLEVTPYSVDFFYRQPKWSPKWLLLPNPSILRRWNALIKEWIGLIVYQMRGYA